VSNSEDLQKQYKRERAGWNLYYDTLETIERALLDGDDFAANLRLQKIIHRSIKFIQIEKAKEPA
jgi:hypothetical protein